MITTRFMVTTRLMGTTRGGAPNPSIQSGMIHEIIPVGLLQCNCSSPKMEQLHCNRPTGIISWIIPDCILGLGAPPRVVPMSRVVTMNRVVIMNGYQALREHAAWLDLSGRGKIRATGEDRARLLHAMTTQQVEQMKPGEGAYAFFLNAQGR